MKLPWTNNQGRLPSISNNIQKIIAESQLEKFCLLPWEKDSVEQDIAEFFSSFIARIKKFTGKVFSDQEITTLYEDFLIWHEEIRGYMKNNSLWKKKDWWKISQLWNTRFIEQFFWDNSFIAEELNMEITEVSEIFSKSRKLYFAIGNISDPMGWIQKWIKWEIVTPFGDFQL